MFGLTRRDKQWLSQQFEAQKGYIMTSAQGVIDAVTAELDGLDQPLATLLTEVQNLVNGVAPNVTALKAAADQVAAAVNSVASAVGTPPVTPPTTP
jgi:division protein CdvB (Snf7/Vps24/ESCRT-III family)